MASFKERLTVFGWLRRLAANALDQELERALAENQALRAQWRAEHGDEPISYTDAERK